MDDKPEYVIGKSETAEGLFVKIFKNNCLFVVN